MIKVIIITCLLYNPAPCLSKGITHIQEFIYDEEYDGDVWSVASIEDTDLYYYWYIPNLQGRAALIAGIAGDNTINLYDVSAPNWKFGDPFPRPEQAKGEMMYFIVHQDFRDLILYSIDTNGEITNKRIINPSEPLYNMFMVSFKYRSFTTRLSLTVNATAGLNVRAGPGTSYKVLSKVAFGDEVERLDSENGWYKIKTSDGTIGWICGGKRGEMWVK